MILFKKIFNIYKIFRKMEDENENIITKQINTKYNYSFGIAI